MDASADRPGVLVLPPLLYLVVLIAGLVAQFFRPIVVPVPWAVRWVAVAAGLAGLVFGGAGRAAFARAGTHANPMKPSTLVVDSGPYSRSRNPMYVGMAVAFLCFSFALRNGWLLILLLPAFALMHWGVILREERYLSAKFGAPYDDYRRRVRRYL